MKKFLLFPVVCFALVVSVNSALAECQLLSCDSFSWYEPNGWIQATEGGSQCWGCGLGPRSCGVGDVVPYMSSNGEILSLHQCTGGVVFSFENVSPGNFCSDSPINSHNASNARTVYKKEGAKTTKTEVGDFDFYSGSSFCKYVYCLDGYMPSPDKKSCVADNRQNACENSGGTWNQASSSCSCSAAKNLRLDSGKNVCVCKNGDYKFNKSKRACEKTQEAQKREEAARIQQQQEAANRSAAQKKQACENSGGTWNSNSCVCSESKNLRTENNVCVCLDDVNYKRQGNECVLTDAAALQKQCDSEESRASGAYWDSTSKQCLCTNPQHVWRGGVCVMNPAIEACQKITGAVWNNLEKVCRCSDPDKEINSAGTACVLTAEAEAAAAAAKITAQINASKTKISAAVEEMNAISAGFDDSVWKNEEGKFNTSRLVSDSVAGVVLGTAGGLITSNVVKKNQVENGFEDIQCTVGGQVVAGWGDQFRVGIQ